MDVDTLTPSDSDSLKSHKSKAEETLQRVLAQAAEILGDCLRSLESFGVSFASEGESVRKDMQRLKLLAVF